MKQIFATLILVLVLAFSALAQAENPTCVKGDGSGGQVQAGTPMKFTVTVSGKTNSSPLEYEWTVSAGKIVSGQGTCSITVDTSGLAHATNITAEVTVKGLPENCPNKASETGSVIVTRIEPEPLDNFGKIPNDEIRARLDAFFVTLANEPNAQGYVVNHGTDKEIDAREKLVKNHIAMRRFDANRITFIRGGQNPRGEAGAWTIVWVMPPGAKPPGID